MGTTRDDIKRWIERGQEEGATHVIVVCDTFDYGDYPVMVMPGEDVRKKYTENNDDSAMKKVMEVYNLSMDIEEQIKEERVFNY